MDEIDYGAAFGIEEPVTTTGEEGTEPAEPSETGAAEPAAQGEEAQEAAAPAGDDKSWMRKYIQQRDKGV